MNKAEMEAHREQYERLMEEADSALRSKLPRKALEAAGSALQYADGMMRHAEKYDNAKFRNVSAVDLILKYAPLLLETDSLDQLQAVLENQRRIERNTTANLGDLLAVARLRLNDCHRLWSHLESGSRMWQEDLPESLGGTARSWEQILEEWEKMGLVDHIADKQPFQVSMVSRFDRNCKGKCSHCGTVRQRPKAEFYHSMQCRNCRQVSLFTLLPE